MFMMNRFFDGAFLTFGVDVIRFLESDQEDRVDPMIFIFPRMTKCIFHKFGVSGEVETHDSICILPLNAVNEKIYVFLWFWFMILGVLSAAVLVYRYASYAAMAVAEHKHILILTGTHTHTINGYRV